MILTKEQVQTILKNKPQGVSDLQVLSEMTKKGYEFEGVNMAEAKKFVAQQETASAQIKKPQQQESFTGSEKAPFQATGEENLITGGLKAIGNLPRSAFELTKDVAQAVVNPIETGKAVVGLVKGTGAKIGEFVLEKTDFGQNILKKLNDERVSKGLSELPKDEKGVFQAADIPELQTFNQATQFFKDRYGSVDKFKETLIEDPASVLADVATVFSGAGGLVPKLGTISKAVEPINAIAKTAGKVKNIAEESKVGQIAREVVPTVTELKQNQVVKALDLTQGDLANISKSTGNDVTEFIVRKNAIKGTPEEVADALYKTRKEDMATVRNEIAKVDKNYTVNDIPQVKQGLDVILKGVDEVPGLESVAEEIKTLSRKDQFTLSDVQKAKELIDENSNIYSKIGDVKSSATARGLDKIRKDLRSFIENEVDKASNGTVDIRKLNNDVQTAYEVQDAINTRSTRNLTRQKLSITDTLVLFGGGATFNPAVGVALYLGKKAIETPSFRLAFTKVLDSKPVAKVQKMLVEIKNKNVSPETQQFINEIADEAKTLLPAIESGSNVINAVESKEEQRP